MRADSTTHANAPVRPERCICARTARGRQQSGEGRAERRVLCSLDARRRPIVRRVDNFKTKPRRPAGHCAKITGKEGKRIYKGGTGTDGVGAVLWERELVRSSVCSSAGKRHASGARLGLLSRANEIPSRPRSANRACRHTRDPLWKGAPSTSAAPRWLTGKSLSIHAAAFAIRRIPCEFEDRKAEPCCLAKTRNRADLSRAGNRSTRYESSAWWSWGRVSFWLARAWVFSGILGIFGWFWKLPWCFGADLVVIWGRSLFCDGSICVVGI